MAKLTEYTAATCFDSGDILIKDGTNGTKKITAVDAAAEFAGLVSSVNHRNVYRGKNLGTSITDSQKTAISSGTFDNLFIGDYWTLNGTRYDIADMDYWYRCGDTSFSNHHLVMIPHTHMYNTHMNSERTTQGGYIGSYMYTDGLTSARNTITADFGSMLLSHREYFINAVSDGYSSGGIWVDSTADLMNEIMIYGCRITSSLASADAIADGGYTTIDKQQLALFRLYPQAVWNQSTMWLRDVVSSTCFASTNVYGAAAFNGANAERGVTPAFAIG